MKRYHSFPFSIGKRLRPHRQKRGQAMVEFSVGLLVLAIAMAALIQLGLLGVERSRTMQKATQRATSYSISDEFLGGVPVPALIANWETGNDGRPYSADDEDQADSPFLIQDGILYHARPDAIANYLPENHISEAYNADLLAAEYDLIRGKDTESNIPLLPIIRRAVYAEDSIDLESEVWMPWLKGID